MVLLDINLPNNKLATLAVVTLELTKMSISSGFTFPSSIKLVMHATNDAKKPTTID